MSVNIVPSSRAESAIRTDYYHPDVQYWAPEWQKVRDCILGEVEIKRKAKAYLPKLESMTDKEYAAYLDRGVFFNMTGRTVTGMVGKLFRRPPELQGLPDRVTKSLETITKDGQKLLTFVKSVASEIFTVGRFGALLDMDQSGKKPPYIAGYTAENIVDWSIGEIEGRNVLTQVVLREIRLSERPAGSGVALTSARQYFASYRVLRLEPEFENDPSSKRVYRQYVFRQDDANASIDEEPAEVITPQRRGVPFDFIPFVFFGPMTNLPGVEKSPMLDIARLNLSHYRSYAQLEHGRYYTALPVYYAAAAPGDAQPEYTVGPSVVWLVAPGERPGIIEFNGSGLKFLENALTAKEAQAATLGGRLMGVTQESTAESSEVAKIKEANEQALLLNVSGTLDTGITWLLRWSAWWQDTEQAAVENVTYEVNKDFILDTMSAREYRAIHAMYMDGVIPIEVVYDYLRRGEVIPDWMAMDEFKKLIDKSASFPNQIDVIARQKGMPSAQSEVDVDEAEKDRELERQLQETAAFHAQEAAKAAAAQQQNQPPTGG